MIVHAFACDYDGTIADRGRLQPPTAAALARVRQSGRKLILVTGRMLDDLKSVCPDVDRMFDAIVAENGALLYLPDRREVKALGEPPQLQLVEELRRRNVPFAVGTSIIATVEEHAAAALAAIRETGLERTLIFNKGSVMLLPGGVTKETGLAAALRTLELSHHNTVGIGDAENDHAFLAKCECAVAVADAVPALRERADYVTQGSDGEGVIEFVEQHLLNDLAELAPRLVRHRLPLGADRTGTVAAAAAHGTNLLIVGPSGSGKSTLTSVLMERLVESGRSICVLDPEGDYQSLAALKGVIVLGGKANGELPSPDELDQFLRHPGTSPVLDLSLLSRPEKVGYATKILATIGAARGATGLPHWLIIDEAHHLLPADGSSASELLRPGTEAVCMITLTADNLDPAVRPLFTALASTDLDAFRAAHATLAHAGAPVAAADASSMETQRPPLERGEAVLAWVLPHEAGVKIFEVGERRVMHRRHVRKYTEGELPPDRSFYFRGREGQLNLRAANLARFTELGEGVDAETWAHHLGQGEYSAWVREMIKDPELAEDIAAVESAGLPPAEARRRIMTAIRNRYAV
jgi:hydroxymethylpyrimidine pyrophosphatase-like HAD family hydrolase/energy-coupling factor transporter ATP-binding protein EcfA2